MGGSTLELNIDALNKLLNWAYDLGRENENREERGIPLIDVEKEMKEYLKITLDKSS